MRTTNVVTPLRQLALSAVVTLSFLPLAALANTASIEAVADQPLQPMGFEVLHLRTGDDEVIPFYFAADQETRPLVVYFEGSGAQSVFTKMSGGINAGLPGWLSGMLENRAHLLVVEKPGIELFYNSEQFGSVEGAPEAFLRNYVPDNLVRRHQLVLEALAEDPRVSFDRVLFVGISDGGQIAAHAAASIPEATHVAVLACGGPTQLFDFVVFQGQPQEGDQPGDAAERIDGVYKRWAQIMEDPESITKFWSGHPYLRWSTFASPTTTDHLKKTRAEIFLAQGTADQAVPIESFDVLVSELRGIGKKITAHRLEGLSHNFQTEEDEKSNSYDKLDQLLGDLLDWALAE